jgi:prefoldin subunit 5
MENLNKDIEFIKNNKIDLKKRITNINKSINESREIIKNMN